MSAGDLSRQVAAKAQNDLDPGGEPLPRCWFDGRVVEPAGVVERHFCSRTCYEDYQREVWAENDACGN